MRKALFSASLALLSIAIAPAFAYASIYGSGVYNNGVYGTGGGSGGGATPSPTVTTTGASSLSATGATLGGAISDIGSSTPTVRGFAYGTSIAYGATTTESGSFSAGSFSAAVSSLTCNTTYHVKSYATNTDGTGYGSDATFTTSACSTGGGGGGGGNSHGGGGGGSIITPPSTPASSASGLTGAQVQSIVGLLGSFGADDATIANVTAALNGTATASTPASSYAFTRDLDVAHKGEDVRQLQIYLNTHGYPVALSAEGSLGQETDYFGPATQAALAKYQAANGN